MPQEIKCQPLKVIWYRRLQIEDPHGRNYIKVKGMVNKIAIFIEEVEEKGFKETF